MQEYYSLSQLNSLVKAVVEKSLDYAYWMQAEIANISLKGHCYMELVEKEDGSNTPIAKASANCWASQWSFVSNNFITVTNTPLRVGMKVLLQVRPTFHKVHGFSWNIINIDPTFTIGDMQRKREEIIRKLKEEGIYDLQKQLPFSPFAKNIAVISAEGAAGYGDFCNQLHGNAASLAFRTELFPAIMQGESVEQSVIAALNRVFDRQDEFDCVVIIRGGGATSDMSGFDSLPLAENVAQFPLPVITGIGHERDNCVLDLISHTRVKTPTAAAVFLIENLLSTLDIVVQAKERIERISLLRIQNEKLRLQTLSDKIPTLFSLVSANETAKLDRLYNRITVAASKSIDKEKHKLQLISEKLRALDPELLLGRGYSMTFANDRLVTSASQVKQGDIITTRLKEGTITTTVTQNQQ
ncbi:MAG: exodeoxyribonuclease VII large subunit [Bacteroidaceae bacterium]|nr:exodeoxyribonuclease VII large subunit [Bacteroidaceae bacterium]